MINLISYEKLNTQILSLNKCQSAADSKRKHNLTEREAQHHSQANSPCLLIVIS